MIASRAGAAAGAANVDTAGIRARMVPPMRGSAFWGWVGPLLVTVFGAFLRFNRLSVPHAVIFDETYYVPDALGILRFGVEHNYVAGRNPLIARGDGHIFARGGGGGVRPPVGEIPPAGGGGGVGVEPVAVGGSPPPVGAPGGVVVVAGP